MRKSQSIKIIELNSEKNFLAAERLQAKGYKLFSFLSTKITKNGENKLFFSYFSLKNPNN